ncbi:phytase [Aureivirga sp. CE67]|uniref:phytase n=1 Tax=Aureivirga sp. CE67 TaxID=1788983 RepID=UPI0018CB96F7|nr:phytase [Aureivirga sp. CE67]
MLKRLIFIALIGAVGCKAPKQIEQTNMETKPFVSIEASAETMPVHSEEDAADDPCIWVNPKNEMESTIIGTDKKHGLFVYDINGKELFRYPVGRVNNVDIRYNFPFQNKKVAIVAASNRSFNGITVMIVNPETRELKEVGSKDLVSNLKEVYGFCLYQNPTSEKTYAFIVSKKGKIEQWELFEKGNEISGKIMRTISVGSQCEGMVADDYYGILYVGEEEKALWKYPAEPTNTEERVRIIRVKDTNMKADFEGVTLYDSGDGKGYVILSSQGNNSYAIFDRISNQYLGSFMLKDGAKVDGTNDTDGIDVSSHAFGTLYPKGFMVIQDGTNIENGKATIQNFKIVNWETIEKALDLKNK